MEREGMRLMRHLESLKLLVASRGDDRQKRSPVFSEQPSIPRIHPEMPSYEEQLAARDRMLGNISFLGAHFGSLEWSVDALARFGGASSAVVDTAARMGQLEYQVSAIGRKSGTLC